MTQEENATISRRKIERDYLPKSIRKIAELMDSDNERLAFAAARWIAEQVLGKARQPLDIEHKDSELALALAEALRSLAPGLVDEMRPPIPPPLELAEGEVKILGQVIEGEVIQVLDDDDFPG